MRHGMWSRRGALRHAFSGALICLALVVAGCGLPGTVAAGGSLPPVVSSPPPVALAPVRFPQDEAPHHDLTEWWYYTGHLSARDSAGHARTYGFELTFFQTLRGQFAPYYAAHFAISDITRGQFHFDQRAAFESPDVIPASGSTSGFNLALSGWTAHGLGGHDSLAAAMNEYAIALSLTGAKPAVLHGGNGIITYGDAGYSYYYSRTRLSVSGTITDHGARLAVTGLAWMDHQWGNFVSLAGAGWDWYSIQLDDGTEYMLYVIRDSEKRPVSMFGTAVTGTGGAQGLQPDALRFLALGSWRSPHTGGIYPSGWRVTIASRQLTLTLMPLLRDQELVTAASTGVAYWEGAVAVRATTAGGRTIGGVGYVELTGYASIPSSSPTAAVP